MEILLREPGWLEKQSSCLKADINLKSYLSLGEEGSRKKKDIGIRYLKKKKQTSQIIFLGVGREGLQDQSKEEVLYFWNISYFLW